MRFNEFYLNVMLSAILKIEMIYDHQEMTYKQHFQL